MLEEEEEEERRLQQLPGKTPNKCPQLWGAKPAGPGVCLGGVTRPVGIFRSGCGCTESGDGRDNVYTM